QNFNFEGKEIKSSTVLNYTADTLTTRSEERRVGKECKLSAAITLPKKYVTFYTGNEGEEKSLLTWNYSFDGKSVKSSTVFLYKDDTLDQSVTFRESVTKADALSFQTSDSAITNTKK